MANENIRLLRRRVVTATIALLSLSVYPAAALNDPALLKPMTIQSKFVTVSEALAEVTKQTGYKLDVAPEIAPHKLNIFVKDQPAKTVLRWFAEVLEGEWIYPIDRPRLVYRKPDSTERSVFLGKEDRFYVSRIQAQVAALAKLSTYPFGQTPQAKPEDPEVWRWACEKAKEPAYYVAGMQHRINSPLLRNFYGYLNRTFPFAFTVEAPADPYGASLGYCSIDPNSQELEGTAIASYADTSFGELRVHTIVGVKPKPDPESKVVLPFLHPAPELAKDRYAQRIAEWETGAAFPNDHPKLLDALPKAWPSGDYSLADQAEVIHRSNGVPVVTDAFRVPIHRKELVAGTTLDYAVKVLRESEQLYARFEDGALLLRHGGFWRLRRNEPPEAPLRNLEAIERPSFSDYADTLGAWMGYYGGLNASLNRIRSHRSLLLRVDPKPWILGAPALLTYAALSPEQRVLLHSGEVLELYLPATARANRLDKIGQALHKVHRYVGTKEERAYVYAVLFDIPFVGDGRKRYQGLPHWASGNQYQFRYRQSNWGKRKKTEKWQSDDGKAWGELESYEREETYVYQGVRFLEYLAELNEWQMTLDQFYHFYLLREEFQPMSSLYYSHHEMTLRDNSVYRGRDMDVRTQKGRGWSDGFFGADIKVDLIRSLYFPGARMSLRNPSLPANGHGWFDLWFGNGPTNGVRYRIEIP